MAEYIHEQILSEKGLKETGLPLAIKSAIGSFRVKQRNNEREQILKNDSQKIAVDIESYWHQLEEKRQADEATAAENKRKEEEQKAEAEKVRLAEEEKNKQLAAEAETKRIEQERIEEENKKKQAMENLVLNCETEVQKLGGKIPNHITKGITAIKMQRAKAAKNPENPNLVNSCKNADAKLCQAIQDELQNRANADVIAAQKAKDEEAAKAAAGATGTQPPAAGAAAATPPPATPPVAKPVAQSTGNSLLDNIFGY